MCVSLPARVVAVDPLGATVETEGRRSRAITLLVPDIAVDEWVLVNAGTIVERLEPERAALIRETLREAIALEEAERVS
jgi:hydrogenase expression/formation protein HypC